VNGFEQSSVGLHSFVNGRQLFLHQHQIHNEMYLFIVLIIIWALEGELQMNVIHITSFMCVVLKVYRHRVRTL
jgi:hypothetical protein